MDTDVRVYYGFSGFRHDRHLTRDEAVGFLATGALPEDILLADASPEQAARYRAATPEKQSAWRRVGGTLTVANGHMVRVDAEWSTTGTTRAARNRWEPYDKQGCEVHFDYADGSGYIAVNGTSRDLGTSLGFLRAQACAVELLAAATTRQVIAASEAGEG